MQLFASQDGEDEKVKTDKEIRDGDKSNDTHTISVLLDVASYLWLLLLRKACTKKGSGVRSTAYSK